MRARGTSWEEREIPDDALLSRLVCVERTPIGALCRRYWQQKRQTRQRIPPHLYAPTGDATDTSKDPHTKCNGEEHFIVSYLIISEIPNLQIS